MSLDSIKQKEGSNQSMKSLEEDQKYKKYKPTFPLSGPRHDMSSCKVIQSQYNSTKFEWPYSCGSGDHGNFNSANKLSSDGKQLNTLNTYAVYKALKLRNIINTYKYEKFQCI